MPRLHPVVLVIVLLFALAICLGAARLVVWFLERRGLSDASGRRQAMVASFGLIALMALSMWLETKPH